jgi:hypothetical protein
MQPCSRTAGRWTACCRTCPWRTTSPQPRSLATPLAPPACRGTRAARAATCGGDLWHLWHGRINSEGAAGLEVTVRLAMRLPAQGPARYALEVPALGNNFAYSLFHRSCQTFQDVGRGAHPPPPRLLVLLTSQSHGGEGKAAFANRPIHRPRSKSGPRCGWARYICRLCRAPLDGLISALLAYCRVPQRYSVCEEHFKSETAERNGVVVRFCQQVGHVLTFHVCFQTAAPRGLCRAAEGL